MEEIKLTKIVHGGQTLGDLSDGRKAFVWGALPGETVKARIIKKKAKFVEAIAEVVLVSAPERIAPVEPVAYLSTSPWQIMNYTTENEWKQNILEETFAAEKLKLKWQKFHAPKDRYGYRNKMEYAFWWDRDTDKISLSLHRRGSHLKLPVTGSILASDAINKAGEKLVEFINKQKIDGRWLKTAIIRSSADGRVAICLFVVNEEAIDISWSKLDIPQLKVYFSNPKSPASLPTKLLYAHGIDYLEDELLGKKFRYAPEGFFQVNLPAYEAVLEVMRKYTEADRPLLDMYAGVGSIGMSLGGSHVICVESDAASAKQAKVNAKLTDGKVEIVHGESEKLLEYIAPNVQVIVDPPRAGLHASVVDKLLAELPPRVIYLSCNPSTQARDLAKLLADGKYIVEYAGGYNFFPATPHIESLVVLTLKNNK